MTVTYHITRDNLKENKKNHTRKISGEAPKKRKTETLTPILRKVLKNGHDSQ